MDTLEYIRKKTLVGSHTVADEDDFTWVVEVKRLPSSKRVEYVEKYIPLVELALDISEVAEDDQDAEYKSQVARYVRESASLYSEVIADATNAKEHEIEYLTDYAREHPEFRNLLNDSFLVKKEEKPTEVEEEAISDSFLSPDVS